MGWTHDYRDAPRDRGSDANATANTTRGHLLGAPPGRGPGEVAGGMSERRGSALRQELDHDPQIGIPRIIRRRARWVSARLRHPRSR
ncbi:hypothetical protein [Streptomyces sp. XD-27]|uniref:hypothetical protein n=1 Tax=Streptomyces sp. XD-27 TaxID=3062779 RepID=UPI0026F41B52|nr:hypothetical protein [Streptomyces sp. XD-27]WKX71741.1 hypothetical protein Q3Y56_19170 [Streptomyces sp. XD-27]